MYNLLRKELIVSLYTLKIRLYPSSEQNDQLLKTMARFNAACNIISKFAFENKIFSKTKLQRFCYYQIRNDFWREILFRLQSQEYSSALFQIASKVAS